MRLLWVLALLLASPAHAGDSSLFVADGNACARPTSGEVHSVKAVVADLNRYFTGLEPQIDVFETALRSGQVGFCSAREREAFEDALISWVVRGTSYHELQVNDFCRTLGSPRMAEDLAARIASAKDPALRDRLIRAREAVRRGVKIRGG
jgi:hypothetical protein